LAKKRKRNRQRIGGRRFEYSDLAWLAGQFKKQAAHNPDLTLEEFAISHGVQTKSLRRFTDVGNNTITLWHGTTADRAKRITREGFRTTRSGTKRKVWFTRNHNYARGVAGSRALARGSIPVVFCCEIDLHKYPNFEKYGPHYAFSHVYISRDVIQNSFRLEEDNQARIHNGLNLDKAKGAKQPPQEADDDGGLVDVIITRNAGKLGVLYWINRYLELMGKAVIEDHPAVEAIFNWVEAEYAAGREEPISDEEMLKQVITNLKQLGQISKLDRL